MTRQNVTTRACIEKLFIDGDKILLFALSVLIYGARMIERFATEFLCSVHLCSKQLKEHQLLSSWPVKKLLLWKLSA